MTEENALSLKAAITTCLGFLTALWGWFGWLVVAWVVCMTIDYLTGYSAAMKNGEWNSSVAREGLWHKGGCIIVVLVAVILDCLVGYLLENIPVVELPFDYSTFLTGLVLIWYILMEIGSIIENVGKLGTKIPPWLRRTIAVLKNSVDAAADKAIPGGDAGEHMDVINNEAAEMDSAEKE